MSVLGGPLPETKFFNSTEVTQNGRTFRAFRHGMAGQPGYEFIGDGADASYVKQVLLEKGQQFGLAHVGALACATGSSRRRTVTCSAMPASGSKTLTA